MHVEWSGFLAAGGRSSNALVESNQIAATEVLKPIFPIFQQRPDVVPIITPRIPPTTLVFHGGHW
ncbi:hypothetical protein FRC06_000469 [Ceratobasidium sp. 370]|nr:hypothetical protein FRC06_000469 [Ceratobasidium sp. 370]